VDAIAQVDLGRRAHRHQALRDLGAMSTQIVATAVERLGISVDDPVALRQYHPVDGRIGAVTRPVSTGERPPAAELLR
jgi:glucosyl-3-phosphoglycerate synthase